MEKKIFSIKKLGRKSLICLVSLMGSMGLTSCTDFLQIEPQNEILLENFWTDKADVENIVAGCYSAMQNKEVVRRMMVWGEFRSDHIGSGDNITSDGDLQKVLMENIDAKNSYTRWVHFYDVINRCNTVIKYAPGVAEKDPGYTEGDLKANIAEMVALRSLAYFYLIRAFRDVPYTTEAYIDDSQKMDLPATKFYDVLDSLIISLEDIQNDAVRRYPETKPIYQTGRITQDAIHAMLCEMYLWKKDYDNCIKYADMVIDSKKKIAEENRKKSSSYMSSDASDPFVKTNGFPLVSSQKGSGLNFGNAYDVVFGSDTYAEENVQEIIFQLVFNDDPNGSGMMQNEAVNTFYGNSNNNVGLVAPNEDVLIYDLSEQLYEVFDKNNKKVDARQYQNFSEREKNIVKFTYEEVSINASSTSNPRATLSGRYTQNQNGANWIIYRLPDIMLMKAEALTQKMLEGSDEEVIAHNKTLLDDAFTLVNAVNKRSVCEPLNNLKDTLVRADYTTKSLMDELVARERQRELMFEGKRWFDLVRYSQRAGNTVTLCAAVGRGTGSKGVAAADLVTSKLAKMDAIYWPYNYEEIKVNKNLVQNPAFGSGEDKSYKKNY